MLNTNAKLISDNIATILTLFPNHFIEPMSGKYQQVKRDIATSFAHIRVQHVDIQDNGFKNFSDEKYVYVTSSTTQYGGENYVSFRRDLFTQWMVNNKLPYVLWFIKNTNEYQLITPEQLREVAHESYNTKSYSVGAFKYMAFRMNPENNKRIPNECPKNTLFDPAYAKMFYKIMPCNYTKHRTARGTVYISMFDQYGKHLAKKEVRSLKELHEMAMATGYLVGYKTMTRRVMAGQLIELTKPAEGKELMDKLYIYATYDGKEDTEKTGKSLYDKYYMHLLDEEVEVMGPTDKYSKENGADIDEAFKAMEAYEEMQSDIDYVEDDERLMKNVRDNVELSEILNEPDEEEITPEELIAEAIELRDYVFPKTEVECQKLYARICTNDREKAHALYEYMEKMWPMC